MIKINVFCVGKVKEKYYSDGIAEYAKRLSGYCKFGITEFAEYSSSERSEISVAKKVEKECGNFTPRLKGYVIALSPEGEKLSSEKFAEKIKSLTDGGTGEIIFLIGGSDGLSREAKERADKIISFSDMTFPHSMFRLMLTEQIYRAFTIMAGTPYHK